MLLMLNGSPDSSFLFEWESGKIAYWLRRQGTNLEILN